MNISWNDAQLFLAIAETGSLSGAAKKLALGQPTISRRLAALEYALGSALFRRSVEGTSPTHAGERLLGPAKKMAEWAGELDRAAQANTGAPQGIVRVTASPFFCADFMAPFAAFLAKKNAGIRLELLASMAYLDLARGEADLALRMKAPTDADLVLLHTHEVKNAVYVSKTLKATLKKNMAFHTLPWISWCPPFESISPHPQLEAAIQNFVPVLTADNFLVHIAAAEAGVGAVVLARVSHRFARPTNLVPLPIELGPHATTKLYLVCAKSALDIPRVRLVAELLVDELKRATKRTSP
jgi:DNA-binding transcriptional LysR family regulator